LDYWIIVVINHSGKSTRK